MVYSYKGKLFGQKRKQNTDTCYNMMNFENIMLSERSQT
jgi:hypothetical protein